MAEMAKANGGDYEQMKECKTCLILCGGLATRFRPITEEIPKALVEINGKPILEQQLHWLLKQGYKKIILACGYKHEMIKDWIAENGKEKYSKYGSFELNLSIEKKPLGTAGAIKLAGELIESEKFLVVNGDNLTDLNLNKLEAKSGHSLTLIQLPFRFGLVDIGNDGRLEFKEKPRLLVNAGIYHFRKDILHALPKKGSLEKEILPTLELNPYIHNGFWKTYDKAEDLK